MTSTQYAVAAVVRRSDDSQQFLAVKRPPSDDDLPNVWGLPAVTLEPGELPEQGVRRVGATKLDTEIEPVRFVGARAATRETHELILMDIEARLLGSTPSVLDAHPEGTKYVDQRWTKNLTVLREAARQGSLCSQVLLDDAGIEY